ncbi:hypothetical protein [Moraxella lacunata]|nr:hypothetical protein [Moraxella lacunata]
MLSSYAISRPTTLHLAVLSVFGNGQHGLCQYHRKPKHAPP